MKAKYLTYLFVITIFSMQALACIINYSIDSSYVWADYEDMAKLSLQNKIVTTPANYNEREYQLQIIKNQKNIPDTIVIGSSRGMYIGKEILHKDSVYNHCVPGGCTMDYFAILGLYQKYWNKLPNNIIFEVSPWVFSDVSPEARWTENYYYRIAAIDYFETITGKNQFFTKYYPFKSPMFSFTYMFTNISKIFQNCVKYGYKKGLIFNDFLVHESINEKEQADLPDGTIRYDSEREEYSKERTEKVNNSSKGAVKYQDCDKMKSLSSLKYNDFKSLILCLKEKNINITIFLSPFSKTQSEWIYKKLNFPTSFYNSKDDKHNDLSIKNVIIDK